MAETIDFKTLRPGQALVLTVPPGMPSWRAQDLLRHARAVVQGIENVRVFVIGDGITAEVLSPARGDDVPQHMLMDGVEWLPCDCVE